MNRKRILAWLLTLALVFSLMPATIFAEEAEDFYVREETDFTVEDTEDLFAEEAEEFIVAEEAEETEIIPAMSEDEVEAVKAMISQLPNSSDVTEDDREAILAAQAAYDALSAEEQAALDQEVGTYSYNTGQPYGRVLESALWGLWSLEVPDNSTTLAPGTYNATTTPALASSYSKGKSTSGRQKPWSVKDITVDENQKVTGTITVESNSYTDIIYHGQTYHQTNTSGNSEFAGVPIDLNSTFYISGVSSSMSIPIAFSITTAIEEPAPKIDLTIENKIGMFKAVTAYLTEEEGQAYVVMALSGTGYHELCKGTYEDAVAGGDGTVENGNGSWIHGYLNDDGKWEFKIPVSADESYVPLVAVSNSYYEQYIGGQNDLARAFYPRQFTLDREAKTLVTDDYKETTEFTITSNVADFDVAASATTSIVGGPNSNGYSVAPTLVMNDATYDKVTYPTVVGSAISTATADLTDGKFAISFENAPNLEAFKDKTPIEVTFHVAADAPYQEAGTDVVRTMTIDKSAKTIVIDGTPLTELIKTELTITNNTGMFKAVTAYLVEQQGQTYLVMALSGTGYKELCKGTYEDAVAGGDGTVENGNGSWIHGYTNADGKLEFKIPVGEGESYMPIVAVSNSYYTKYLNGQNPLERAFYPRQATLDIEAKTLVTDDYKETTDFTVTSNVADFDVAASATTSIVGGPNSNGYSVSPILVMNDATYDKVTFPTVEGSAVTTASADLTDGAFAISMTNAPNLEAFKDKTPIEMTFHVAENAPYVEAGTDVVRTLTIDKSAKTIVINGEPLTGKIDLAITNNTGMFKAVTAYLIEEEGKIYLVMALSGTGYKELCKGTYEDAVAGGDGTVENGNGSWIHGYTNADGKLEFKIPVGEGESYMPIVAVSNSYYTKYLNGQNPLERAFYPRQATLDIEAKTLVTDDYKETTDFTVTSNVADFDVAASATTSIVGGPNSNGYSVAPTLVMNDAAYDKVTYPTVVGSAISTATAELTDGKFAIAFTNAPNLEAFKDKTPIEVTFHVAEDALYEEAGTDVVRTLTIDKSAKTIVIDGEPLTKKIAYEDSHINFIKEDGAGFGMWSPQQGTTVAIDGDNVVIHYVPKNKTTYAGFVWGSIANAAYADETAVPETDITVNEDGTIDITVGKEYCGYGHMIAPIKKSFTKGSWTSADQYYFAIPSEEDILATGGHTPAEAVEETIAATYDVAEYVDSVVYCSVCGEELSRTKDHETGVKSLKDQAADAIAAAEAAAEEAAQHTGESGAEYAQAAAEAAEAAQAAAQTAYNAAVEEGQSPETIAEAQNVLEEAEQAAAAAEEKADAAEKAADEAADVRDEAVATLAQLDSTVDKTLYTASTYAVYEEAYNAFKALVLSDEATASNIRKARGAVTKAYAGLVEKEAQDLALKATAKSVGYATTAAGAKTYSMITVTGAADGATVKYSKSSGSSYLTVNSSTGKITVKKGTPAGKQTATIKVTSSATDDFLAASKTVKVTVTVNKADQPMTAKGSTKTVKAANMKKANQTVTGAITVSKAQGTVTYKKTSGNAKITINSSTGKITVKKGLAKGTYKVKIKVTAAGNKNYKSGSKTVTVTIKVN